MEKTKLEKKPHRRERGIDLARGVEVVVVDELTVEVHAHVLVHEGNLLHPNRRNK